jgi:dTDP-4-dehydrorhamnose 3,5-epimerase
MIEGVIVKNLNIYADDRGWLTELIRSDELPEGFESAMSYLSMTLQGTTRGPHEHREQTDYFCFVGPSDFKVYLWDNRAGSATYGERQVFVAGAKEPRVVVVPPGVVHAYKNIGDVDGLVFNAPDRLYKGEGKAEEVDEIRHEADENSDFKID